MEGDLEQTEEMRDSKKEVLNRRISFWLSFTLAVVITFWYYAMNPPDTNEMRKMRVFFKENIMDIAKFIRLPRDELKEFADSKSHPFYQTYLKSSKPEKEKINALIHISRDYSPNQYWFNMLFLWTIAFSALWFLGLILEACIILVRQEDAERKKRIKTKSR
ncbi:MAG: hypothetical protein HN465_02265 [Nitrospina sp.]|nr:hypothetical protein [Nitrospina sp.]